LALGFEEEKSRFWGMTFEIEEIQGVTRRSDGFLKADSESTSDDLSAR
jgi:hypothetical protein